MSAHDRNPSKPQTANRKLQTANSPAPANCKLPRTCKLQTANCKLPRTCKLQTANCKLPRTCKLQIIVPHGFCAGVTHAIKTADARLQTPGAKLYCLHELVHNEMVVRDLQARGMVFVENLDEVPAGATVLFSAHGVAPSVRETARRRNLQVVDATCPFVERVHVQVRKYAACGAKVVIIGHEKHAETIGTAGEMPDPADVAIVASAEDVAAIPFPQNAKVGVAVQTTMNRDDIQGVIAALRKRFANLEETPSANVCHATRERQQAVRDFVENSKAASGVTGVLVLGSANSSNTRRLEEIALASGADWTARAGNERDLEELQIPPLDALGVTSGASTPESFLSRALAFLSARIHTS